MYSLSAATKGDSPTVIGGCHSCDHIYIIITMYSLIAATKGDSSTVTGGCHSCDHMVVRFTITYAISAYHHLKSLNPVYGSVLETTLSDKVC